jgi:hypothetical protein
MGTFVGMVLTKECCWDGIEGVLLLGGAKRGVFVGW